MKPNTLFSYLIGIALLLLVAQPACATNRMVTNLNDSGAGSLRDTIAVSADGDTIDFSVTGTINLTSAELAIAHSITINGPGANVLTISNSNNGSYRIFDITSGIVSISGLTISNGRVSMVVNTPGGGGISNNGTLTLNSCAISSNQAGGFGEGGGILNWTSGVLTMVNCTVSNNSAGAITGGDGGGILNVGTLSMINSTVSGNAVSGGSAQLCNSAIGGGILNSNNGTLSMVNCTVSNNSATVISCDGFNGSATGGGIYDSSGSNASLRNTIVAGNTLNTPFGGMATDPDVFGSFSSQGHNLIGNTGDSSGWIASDKTNANAMPLNLGPLQQAGGPTQTMPLRSGSVAIDAADDSVLGPPLNLTTDQRGPGFARSVGAHVDIGAVEFRVQSGPAFIVTTTDDHDSGVCADECTLREAINAANTAPGDNTITFAPGVTGTIQLGSALPNLSTNITVQGPGPSALTVRRNTSDVYRIFTISNGTTTGPTVSISGLTIRNGTTSSGSLPDSGGGGILEDHAVVTLNSCVLTSNTGRYGGGIFNLDGTLTINNSAVSGNQVTDSSGALYNYGATGGANLTATNSTFNGNLVTGSNGGAGVMDNYGGAATFTNCTFYFNSSYNQGAIYNNGIAIAASLTLRSCTFSENSTGNSSSGNILNSAAFGGTATLTMSSNIFKTGAQGANLVNSGGTVISQGYNLSNDAAGGDNGIGPGGLLNATGDIRNTDPVVGALANNGGPTLTVPLLSGSPAINHGDPNAPLQDQRYYLRSGAPDIGAFEFGGTLAPISAVSRKTHGASTFDINLPLVGTAGVECRSGGATNDYLLVVNFPTSVTVTNAQVTTGTGNVSGLDNDAHGQLTIHLTGVTNAQRIVTTLSGVSDGANTADVTIPMGVLVGDTSGNGTVNATDVSLTKLKSGQAVDASNFREDVSANGVINSSDVSTVKLKSGTALP